MAVENPKETTLGPVLDILFRRRLHDIKYDADSVLIIVSDYALVCIRSVAHDQSVFTD